MTALRITLILLACAVVPTLSAAEPPTVTSPGKAVSGSKELPAEIRGFCLDSGEIQFFFTLTFKTIGEADAFFPLGLYEGPDGKNAPLEIGYTRDGKAVTAHYKAAAAWFGVKNDYIFSLRPADARTLVTKAAATPGLTVTLVQGAKKLSMMYPAPGEALNKIGAMCKK